jgi:heat shock protein HslJ
MRRLLPLLAMLSLVLAACSTSAEGSWVLVSYLHQGETIELVEDITLDIDGSDIGGFSGCNTYFGSVVEEGGEVTFTEVGSTLVFCDDQDVMALEARYLNDLVENSWVVTVDDTTLSLVAAAPDEPTVALPTELRFEANS